MELRDHPMMNYRGLTNWPPIWTWRGGGESTHPKGEVGILRDVFLSRVEPNLRIFLIMGYEDQEYIGCLLFGDATVCEQIYDVLKDQCGRTLAEVGSLDLDHLG
jgi:hypothetical protein